MTYYTKHSGNNIQRFHDLKPILTLMENKSVLDIGSNIGMLGIEAYRHGVSSYTGIEPDKNLNRSSCELLWGLKPEPKIISTTGESEKARKIISNGYDFIFLLSVIQYLPFDKFQVKEYLDFILSNTRHTLVLRLTNYQLDLIDYINNNKDFTLAYFSSLNPTNLKMIPSSNSKISEEEELNISNMSNVYAFSRVTELIATPIVVPSTNIRVNSLYKKGK